MVFEMSMEAIERSSLLRKMHTCTWLGKVTHELVGNISIEEHVFMTAKSAFSYSHFGYYMRHGVVSSKGCLDCVVIDMTDGGDVPGLRYLARAQEITRQNGELTFRIPTSADRSLELRESIRLHKQV